MATLKELNSKSNFTTTDFTSDKIIQKHLIKNKKLKRHRTCRQKYLTSVRKEKSSSSIKKSKSSGNLSTNNFGFEYYYRKRIDDKKKFNFENFDLSSRQKFSTIGHTTTTRPLDPIGVSLHELPGYVRSNTAPFQSFQRKEEFEIDLDLNLAPITSKPEPFASNNKLRCSSSSKNSSTVTQSDDSGQFSNLSNGTTSSLTIRNGHSHGPSPGHESSPLPPHQKITETNIIQANNHISRKIIFDQKSNDDKSINSVLQFSNISLVRRESLKNCLESTRISHGQGEALESTKNSIKSEKSQKSEKPENEPKIVSKEPSLKSQIQVYREPQPEIEKSWIEYFCCYRFLKKSRRQSYSVSMRSKEFEKDLKN